MKKVLKRGLSLFLVVTAFLGILTVSSSAQKPESVYTVLGDSNASGYGLADYERQAEGAPLKEGNRIKGSFADIVTDELGFTKLNVCTHCGWRVDEALFMLDPVKYPQYSNFMMTALEYDKDLDIAAWQKKIQSSVAESDLITVSFGSNDLLTWAARRIWEEDYELIESLSSVTGFSGVTDFEGFLTKLLETPATALDAIKLVHTFEVKIGENLEHYREAMQILLDELISRNPNAEIMVIGLFNPMNISYITQNGTFLSLVSTMDILTATANAALRKMCAERENCTFVDCRKTENFGVGVVDWNALLSGDETGLFSVLKVIHANEEGHAYIAQNIVDSWADLHAGAPVLTLTKSIVLKKNILTWSKVEGAKAYRVYRAESADGKYQPIGTAVGGVFYDAAAQAGKTYYYKVCAVMKVLSGTTAPMSNIVAA